MKPPVTASLTVIVIVDYLLAAVRVGLIVAGCNTLSRIAAGRSALDRRLVCREIGGGFIQCLFFSPSLGYAPTTSGSTPQLSTGFGPSRPGVRIIGCFAGLRGSRFYFFSVWSPVHVWDCFASSLEPIATFISLVSQPWSSQSSRPAFP